MEYGRVSNIDCIQSCGRASAKRNFVAPLLESCSRASAVRNCVAPLLESCGRDWLKIHTFA